MSLDAVIPGTIPTIPGVGLTTGTIPVATSSTALGDSHLKDGISGSSLSFAGTLTVLRTVTARDASGNLCLDTVDNLFNVAQTIDRGTGALPATAVNAGLVLANANAINTRIIGYVYGASGFALEAYHASGTRSVPTATADLSVMHQQVVGGHDGTAFQAAAAYHHINADGLWSGANRGVSIDWEGTPNGSTTRSLWMRLQNASLGLVVTPTAGNGLIQLASGTTKANGVAYGDTSQFRASSGSIFQSGPAATDIIYAAFRNTGETAYLWAGNGICYFGSSSATPVSIRTGNVAAINVDTAQGVTTAAANYVKVRSVAASAGTTTLDATDATAILTGAAIHTFTLPAASNGRRLFIKNRSSLALTVNRAGADTIDGLTTIAVATGTAKILIANGADWCVWNA